MRLRAYFYLSPVSATGLRSAMPVRAATTGRQFRTRTATTRGASTSVARTASSATSGGLFVLSKGSPNSEHTRAHSIL